MCTAIAGLEMQLPEESDAVERPVCRATKRVEEETKSFGAKLDRGESQKAQAGRAAEWAATPSRGDSSRGTEPGWGPAARSSARWDSEN